MMTQVFRIVKKDFQVQRKSIMGYMIVGLVLVLAFSLMNMTQKEMLYAIAGFAIIYGFVNKALYEDEKNNTLRLLVSLPVQRDILVYARYLSTFIIIFVLGLVMSIISAITGRTTNDGEGFVAVIIILVTLLVFIVMLSFYLPLAFKLGYIKAAGINRFIFLGIFAFFSAVAFILNETVKNGDPGLYQKLDGFLATLDPALVLACFSAAILLLYLVSMRISIHFFRKRLLF